LGLSNGRAGTRARGSHAAWCPGDGRAIEQAASCHDGHDNRDCDSYSDWHFELGSGSRSGLDLISAVEISGQPTYRLMGSEDKFEHAVVRCMADRWLSFVCIVEVRCHVVVGRV
jgi:hypothetical protein